MPGSRRMTCVGLLVFASFANAQTTPTAYSITENGGDITNSATLTFYRDGARAVIDRRDPAQAGSPAHRTVSYYDIKAGISYTWDPATNPPGCSGSSFSGDWGDPFAMTAEVSDGIAKGELKPAGTETVAGVATKVYTNSTPQTNMKVWFDEKDGLVIRASFGPPAGPMQTLVDIKKVSLGPPPASVFALPTYCAPYHPGPTAAELIANETGDNAANFVNAIYGPGSKDSCSVILRVVRAGTMAPLTTKYQVAIDTSYDMDKPPHYEFGVATDGTQTYSGGGIREITSQIRNGMVRIDNPPAYFNLGINLVKPGYGGGMGLIYRQCFGPQTVLYYVVKNPDQPSEGGDYLWAKSGKYATVP